MRTLPLLTVSALLALAPPVHAHDGHVHATRDVAAEAAPAITGFTVSGTPAEGFTVTVKVENFTFVEEGAEASGPNPGHVHLTINGTDLGMFYAPVFTLDELPYGPHDFEVVLSDTDLADYAIAGRPIGATTSFTVE